MCNHIHLIWDLKQVSSVIRDWIRPSTRLISGLYLFISSEAQLIGNMQALTPYRGILMRLKLHAVTWIPIKSRFLPVVAERLLRAASAEITALCLCECCDLVSQTPPCDWQRAAGMLMYCNWAAQSPRAATRCEASAKVSGEIQLRSRQSLIDNRFWKPSLKRHSQCEVPRWYFGQLQSYFIGTLSPQVTRS